MLQRTHRNAPLPLPSGPPDPGLIRSQVGLTQAAMAAALGVTPNTWARWERGTLAIQPAYQLLLDLIEQKAERDADRVAARLQAPGGVRNLW
jgi:transcriptional regulator with XRE-family HTH domain